MPTTTDPTTDTWNSLPPAVQSALHNQIAAGLTDGTITADTISRDPLAAVGSRLGYDTAGARRAGLSDPQIAWDMTRPTAGPDTTAASSPAGTTAADATTPPADTTPPDTSFLSALHFGAARAAHGLGATLKELGAVGIGQTIQDAIAAPAGYQPASVGMAHATSGLDALGYVPRWMLEEAPDVAGAAAAGAAGTALGGPIGTAGGVIGYGEARHLGENLAATRVQNGGADPGFGGNVGAALLSGGEGAMEGLGAPAGVLKLARLGVMAGKALASTAQVVPIVPAGGYMAYRAMNPDDDDDGPQAKAARRSLIRRTLDWWAAHGGGE